MPSLCVYLCVVENLGFIRLLCRKYDLDARGDCDVRVWLCQIAKNCYYSFLKNSGKEENIDTPELLNIADPEIPVEEQFARKETAMELQRLLHLLPEPYKEVFMWRTYP